ncbi:PREDICTED: uncharacterized protein LOC105624004 [Atta cephalotes]|uniref:Uncharacterized protein n=1 Tax=Atta cephalotes TaxID=12957 RepID=A0A158NTA6_ATTCE|nr:PREDICTED: uncharacterized protein LOC105624004 [Atta cephalotes]
MSPHFRSDHDAVTMGSLIIVLTVFAVYCSAVYCDTLPTKVAKPEDTVLLERNNASHATIEKGTFWKNLSLSKRKPTKVIESRNLDNINNGMDKRKGRFLSSLAFLTGLSFGELATVASSTMKNIAKIPQMLSINLGSSKTSPYFAAYYSQYPYTPLLPYPLIYPGAFGLAPMIDAAKPQTSQNDLTPQVINLFDNRPNDIAENNEDYTDAETSNVGNGADDRIRLRAEADRNAEEKNTIRGCKEGQRRRANVKETAREREYLHENAVDLRASSNFRRVQNSTEELDDDTTSDKPTMRPNTTTTILPDNTTHHHHHHHHHIFPGYYGGYPQNIHHVDLTTSHPYNQIGYNAPDEHNFYQDDKYNVYQSFNPSLSAPFPSDQPNEFASTDYNRVYPSGYPPLNISDGFIPLK